VQVVVLGAEHGHQNTAELWEVCLAREPAARTGEGRARGGRGEGEGRARGRRGEGEGRARGGRGPALRPPAALLPAPSHRSAALTPLQMATASLDMDLG